VRIEHAPQRDLRHEAHLRAIGIWQGLAGALGLLSAGLVFLLALAQLATAPEQGLLALGGGVGVAAVSLLYLASCIGLWTRRSWGLWVTFGFAALGLFSACGAFVQGLPGLLPGLLGLAWNGAVLWALTSDRARRVAGQRYQDLVARQPNTVAWWASPFFYLPALLVGLSLLAGLVLLVMALLAVR
jgi:hypothetical protein